MVICSHFDAGGLDLPFQTHRQLRKSYLVKQANNLFSPGGSRVPSSLTTLLYNAHCAGDPATATFAHLICVSLLHICGSRKADDFSPSFIVCFIAVFTIEPVGPTQSRSRSSLPPSSSAPPLPQTLSSSLFRADYTMASVLPCLGLCYCLTNALQPATFSVFP